MGFDRPTRTIDYIDLKAETAKGPRRIAFRILQFLPAERGDFTDRVTGEKQWIYPVLADAKLLDGPNAGNVYRGKTYKYGITNALRDAGSSDPQPRTTVGAELMVIAARATSKGVAKDSVFGNRPDDDEMDEMIAAFDALGGWDQSINPDGQPQPAASNGAAQPAASTPAPAQPTGQAAGSGARRPFGRRTTVDA
jgi:hypothetical protein